MLILSKLLPLFVLPPGICLLLAIAGLLFKRRYLVWIALALLWALSLPVVGDALMRRIEMPYHRIPVESVRRADAIVVLSGMLRQLDGAPLGEFGEAADRFEGGVDLFRAGKAPVLVFTGGQMPWQPDAAPEGELLAARARLRGVPAGSIRLTSTVANTAGEAVATAALLGVAHGKPKRIILVTSTFHMSRALMLFRAAGFEVEPFAVDFRATDQMRQTTMLDFLPDANGLDASAMALREMIGRTVYRFALRVMMPDK
ncbi:YdcF family protein [Chlorobaculum thiosulfatiphilum]|uniref:YdcF family protein n=1 Tax=Chlorobaculum thiosulfatiphilum TaxID=115852 RepID=A0A5C4S6Z0_CHLTI|nr:YdcF family protein [Chlorobaculum thiosulfatiphilum]TNJ39196.1 YdcF family protein [Chlorobaculum thiosulfatiphilum]